MAFEYEIFPEHGLVVTVASGSVDDTQIRSHSTKIISDPRHVERTRELCSLERAVGASVSIDALRGMVADDSIYMRRFHSYQLAIVAPEDLTYGMARVYQALCSSLISNMQVFRKAEDAYEWLELTEEEVALVEETKSRIAGT